MGINNAKPKTGRNGRKSGSKSVSVMGRMYERAMDETYTSKEGRRPQYRPSSFPICSVLTYMSLIEGASKGYFEEEKSAASDYFTSVGTAAHENIQFYMGISANVFGDWKCTNVDNCKLASKAMDLYDANGRLHRRGKRTRKNTTNNICPCCNSPMTYIEKQVNYMGLKGHIDCILLLDDGTYWIGDYKTSTKYKLQSGKLPERSHLRQLPAYCYVLEKKYNLTISGFSLLYFSRDNPFNFYEYAEKWTSKWRRKIKKEVKNERIKFRSAVNSFAELDPEEAIANKPCKTLAYYEKEIAYFKECPMLGVCFNPKKLRNALQEHKENNPTTKKDREKLISTINIDGDSR